MPGQKFIVTLRGHHGGVVAAQGKLRQKHLGPQRLGALLHLAAQGFVCPHTACNADAHSACVTRSGQQFFGQYLGDAPLKAGGHAGHIHLFPCLTGAVHRVQHRCFQARKTDVVRALHMGRGQGVGRFAAAQRRLGHCRAARVAQALE